MPEYEKDFQKSKRGKIEIVNNQHFFARIEFKGPKVWLVWGNPQQMKNNETLIKITDLRKIYYCLGVYLGRNDPY